MTAYLQGSDDGILRGARDLVEGDFQLGSIAVVIVADLGHILETST